MFLCNTQGNSEKEEYYFKIASQNKVDGIICVSYRDKESYISEDIPIISLDRHFEKKISCICSDNYHGGEIAAQKMISTGSRCSLRPLAVANAFFNGRYAEQNGRSYLVDC